MKHARTYLFVPGDRPERFDKAAASGADRVIIDLEDAVAADAKAAARTNITQWLGTKETTVPILVRINGITTPWHEADLDLLGLPNLDGVMLPKTEDANMLALLRERLHPNQELHALVETVAGLVNLRAIAATVGLTRIAFGAVDFAQDAGIQGSDRELDYVRGQFVIESRYAGLPAPIDGVTMTIDDEALLASEVRQAKQFGFGAKLCIHPRQVPVVQLGFAPSNEERDWAERVLAAVEKSPHGAITVEGKFVDQPVIERARAIAGDGG